jgi:phosphoserine phosphatase
MEGPSGEGRRLSKRLMLYGVMNRDDRILFEGNRPFKLVIFDLDGTLTRERSIWQYIHERLGKWYGYSEQYQRRFLAGEISYEEFCELDAQVWKGMRVEALLEIVKTVPFHPGASELVRYLKDKGLKLAMVSSGLSVLSDWVHQEYGFDYSVSNELLHENGVLTGKVRIQVHYDQKAQWVRKILEQFGARPQESIAIGDSLGDKEMLQMAGFSVAFNSSCQDLEEIADICVKDQNLANIIPELPL